MELKDYKCYSLAHRGHSKSEYLDDDDFNYLVNLCMENYSDFNDVDEEEIEDAVRELVYEARTDCGYKYGEFYNGVIEFIACRIAQEVRSLKNY